jgi:asparagine synthase (glutamine-hydrolysing)
MPGIVGLQTRMPRGWAERRLKQMLNALKHEHFYATGTWIDEAIGVYIGWVARNNSFSDGMPMRNDQRDLTLIFSGEDFSTHATKQRKDTTYHDNAGAPFTSYDLPNPTPAFPPA